LQGKEQRGLASLVIRFFFLYRMLLVGSVSFFSRTNGMSRYAGICGVLWVTWHACTYCEVLLEKSVSLVCQQVPGVFLNPIFHYRIHKSPAHTHILNLLNSVHTLLFTIHFNIIIQPTPVFQAVYCFQVSQPQFYMHLHACNMPSRSHRSWFDHQGSVWTNLAASCRPLPFPQLSLYNSNNLQTTDRPTDCSTPRVFHLRTHDKYDRSCAACAVRLFATSPGRLSPNIRASSM